MRFDPSVRASSTLVPRCRSDGRAGRAGRRYAPLAESPGPCNGAMACGHLQVIACRARTSASPLDQAATRAGDSLSIDNARRIPYDA
jgi:hypothetical protein